VRRLSRLIPPRGLGLTLTKLADRLEELAKTGEGAELELHIHVVRGEFFWAGWDADERIG